MAQTRLQEEWTLGIRCETWRHDVKRAQHGDIMKTGHAGSLLSKSSFITALSQSWTHLESPDSLFCAGHTILSDGRVVIVGGHIANAGWPAGIQNIRSYSDGDPGLIFETTMRYPRWYATATLLPNQQVNPGIYHRPHYS